MSFINKLTQKEFNELLVSTKTLHFVDFYADWCGPCTRMLPIIENYAQDPDFVGKINFHKVNVDYEEDLSLKFGVRGIPYFVLFETEEKEGKFEILKNWVGTQDPFKLKADMLLTLSASNTLVVSPTDSINIPNSNSIDTSILSNNK